MLAKQLYDVNKGEVYHYDIFKNPFVWDGMDLALFNSESGKLIKIKQKVIDYDYTDYIERGPIKVASNDFIYVGLTDEFYKKYLTQEEFSVIKEYRNELEEKAQQLIAKVVRAALYDDLAFQVANRLLKGVGLETIKMPSNAEEWEELLDGPFKNFYDTAFRYYISLNQSDQIKFKKDLDTLVIKKTGKIYTNPDFPTENIALLAREHLLTPDGEEFVPKLWQIWYLWHEVDYEYKLLATARQRGKTLISALIGMMIMFQKRRGDILYVVETDEKSFQPKEYFERVLKKYKQAKIIKFREDVIENVLTGNKLKFVSARARSGLKSYSHPYIMVDEASFIPNDVIYSLTAIAMKPGHHFYGHSTIDWDAVKHGSTWFWEQLQEAELGVDLGKPTLAVRVTLDEDESVSQQEKKFLEKTLKQKDPARYYADYYCTLLQENNEIPIYRALTALSPDKIIKDNEVVQYVIGYDPAKKTDEGGLVINAVIIRKMKDKARLVLVPIAEYHWQEDYVVQARYITEIIDGFDKAVTFVMDTTGVGAAVEEIVKNEIIKAKTYPTFRQIIYHSGRNVTKEGNVWYVPKEELVQEFKTAIAKKNILVPAELSILTKQAAAFKKVRGTWQGRGEKDDVFTAQLNATFVFNKEIIKEEEYLNYYEKKIQIIEEDFYYVNEDLINNYI